MVEGLCTTSPFIHHLAGGWLVRGEEEKGEGKKGEGDYWDLAYIHFSGPAERRDSQKGRCISRTDLWGLDLLRSLHSIHHSDNKK